MIEHHRQIAFCVEVSGLELDRQHRVIEIGAVEIYDGHVTGGEFHRHFFPERAIEEEASGIHGLTLDFLQNKPVFADKYERLKSWFRSDELIILSNLDGAFLDAEYRMQGDTLEENNEIVVVLDLASFAFPNQKNTLSDLCSRLDVEIVDHCTGALLDAYALAEAYIALTKRYAPSLRLITGGKEV